MRPFEIFIAYLAWGDEGKDRPVLMLKKSDDNVLVYPITTKYDGKSEIIKAKLYKIEDWKLSGLDKVSFIDTGELTRCSVYVIDENGPIGKLTDNDKRSLLMFLKENQ